MGTAIGVIAAGLWHTLCVTVDGQVYSFGGNQFGQLGTGSEDAEACHYLPLGSLVNHNSLKCISVHENLRDCLYVLYLRMV